MQKDLEIEKEASYHISIKVCSVPVNTTHSRSLGPSCISMLWTPLYSGSSVLVKGAH